MMNCKICGGKLVKESWTSKKDSWINDIPVPIRCPAGTFEYYECPSCGMRYTPQEAEIKTNETDAI